MIGKVMVNHVNDHVRHDFVVKNNKLGTDHLKICVQGGQNNNIYIIILTKNQLLMSIKKVSFFKRNPLERNIYYIYKCVQSYPLNSPT